MDRVATTGAAFLGLTLGCARCHDHKFDPVSQKEFYQLFAYFNNVDEITSEAERYDFNRPILKVPAPEEIARQAGVRRAVVVAEQRAGYLCEGTGGASAKAWRRGSLEGPRIDRARAKPARIAPA